jgi:hypothetical protein
MIEPCHNAASLCFLSEEMAAQEHSAAKPQLKRFGVRRLVGALARRDSSRRTRRRVAWWESGDKSPHSKILAVREESDTLQCKGRKKPQRILRLLVFFAANPLLVAASPRCVLCVLLRLLRLAAA